MVGVSADSVKSHLKFATRNHLDFPLLADENKEIIAAYDVWGPKKVFGREMEGIIRTSFVIGVNGVIERVITEVETAAHAIQILKG